MNNTEGSLGLSQRMSFVSTAVLIMLMLCYLIMTISNSTSLADQTEIISNHPFEVVISAGDVRYEGQNPVGFAYPKISAEHVRRIAEPFYYLHDMLPCFFGHILVVVKGSGNRCDRNIGFPRNILNCDDSVHLPVTTIRRNLRLVSKLIYFSVYFTST